MMYIAYQLIPVCPQFVVKETDNRSIYFVLSVLNIAGYNNPKARHSFTLKDKAFGYHKFNVKVIKCSTAPICIPVMTRIQLQK